MRKVKSLIIMVMVVVFINGMVWGEYLDVGDDPARIQVVETKILVEGKNCRAHFSPDGEFVSIKYGEKIVILNDKGVKKFEIPKGFFSRWFPDSKKLFYHVTFEEGYYFDVTTGKSHKINYKRKDDGYMVDITENNELVLYKRKYRRDLNDYEYSFILLNVITGVKNSVGNLIGRITTTTPMKLIEGPCLLYEDSKAGYYFYKFNFQTGIFNKLYSGKLETLSFKAIPRKKTIFLLKVGITIVLLDQNYQVICKFDAVIPKGEDPKIWTDDLIPSDCISIAPNGKLVLLEMETGYLEDDAVSDGIYIYNCRGKYKKINNLEPIHIDWSAKGDKILISTGLKILLLTIQKM